MRKIGVDHNTYGDPAVIVRSIQTSLRQSGLPPATPPVILLSGWWSAQLSSNFVLTFAGQPSVDDVFRLRKVLCSPFGQGSSILPQRGYTRVAVHSVPVIYDDKGNQPLSDVLSRKLSFNPACQGLLVVSPPKWLRSTLDAEKTHSSILFAFVDEDGSRLAHLIQSPIFLFSSPCTAKLFNSLPLVRQCDRCHKLGHSTERCHAPKNVVICPVCGGKHAARDHTNKCPTGNKHTDLYCRCPQSCFNCVAARLPGKGHISWDLMCPLRKRFRHKTNRTGDATNEDPDRPMVVDGPPAVPTIPSSQPTEDKQIAFRTTTPLARIDDPPCRRSPPSELIPILADMAKWGLISDPSYFSSLPLKDLTNLSDYGHAKAFSLGVNIRDLIQSLTHA